MADGGGGMEEGLQMGEGHGRDQNVVPVFKTTSSTHHFHTRALLWHLSKAIIITDPCE